MYDFGFKIEREDGNIVSFSYNFNSKKLLIDRLDSNQVPLEDNEFIVIDDLDEVIKGLTKLKQIIESDKDERG